MDKTNKKLIGTAAMLCLTALAIGGVLMLKKRPQNIAMTLPDNEIQTRANKIYEEMSAIPEKMDKIKDAVIDETNEVFDNTRYAAHETAKTAKEWAQEILEHFKYGKQDGFRETLTEDGVIVKEFIKNGDGVEEMLEYAEDGVTLLRKTRLITPGDFTSFNVTDHQNSANLIIKNGQPTFMATDIRLLANGNLQFGKTITFDSKGRITRYTELDEVNKRNIIVKNALHALFDGNDVRRIITGYDDTMAHTMFEGKYIRTSGGNYLTEKIDKKEGVGKVYKIFNNRAVNFVKTTTQKDGQTHVTEVNFDAEGRIMSMIKSHNDTPAQRFIFDGSNLISFENIKLYDPKTSEASGELLLYKNGKLYDHVQNYRFGQLSRREKRYGNTYNGFSNVSDFQIRHQAAV